MKSILIIVSMIVYLNAYVGDKKCQECHQSETKLWKDSHHDLAMQKVSNESVLGDFDNTTFTYNGIVSSFFKKDDKFMVRTDGADGKLHDYEISYVFGVYPLQQYMIEFPDGRVQVLDISWDTRSKKDGGQRWFHLHPDDNVKAGDVLHWSGPNLNWNYMCADCHSTNLKKNYDSVTDTYNTTYDAINVSCEECHGDGTMHVSQPKKHKFENINMMKCAKCHSRRTQIGDDFHKDSKFSDNYLNVFLRENLYFSDGKIKDEVYVYNSFLQSKMYEDGVTCKDCHDPHSLKLKGGRENVCFSCHDKPKYASEKHSHHKSVDCVSCHMPPRVYMGVDARNDHSFRIPRPDLSLNSDTPNACNICHKDKSVSWSNEHMKKWYKDTPRGHQDFFHQMEGLRSNSYEAPQFLYDMLTSSAPQITKATAATFLGNYPSQQTYFTTMQLLRHSDEQTRLGALIGFEQFPINSRVKQLVKMLDDSSRPVRMEAAKQLSVLPTGNIPPEIQKKLSKALKEYEDSLLFIAERAESQTELGNLYTNLGQMDKAKKAYERALEIQPKYVPAYVNYSDFLRSKNQDKEAYKLIVKGIKKLDDIAILHHILGLYYIRNKETDKALLSLKKASELDKDDARIQYTYAVALADSNMKESIQILEDSLKKHTGDLQTLYALAYYYEKLGNYDKSKSYKDKAEHLNNFKPRTNNIHK